MKKAIITIFTMLAFAACSDKEGYDAAGSFESDEVTVSAEGNGRILGMNVSEGDQIAAGQVIAYLDSTQLVLQKEQLLSQKAVLRSSFKDVDKQLAALREQLSYQNSELKRLQGLYDDGATPQKQLSDAQTQVRILKSQLEAQQDALVSGNETIKANLEVLDAQIAIIEENIARCTVKAPLSGTILARYLNAGEMAAAGRPLVKIADLDNVYLRSYFTSEQLSGLTLGREVNVIADFGGNSTREYKGRIVWISDQSEFTPKTIQTTDSRANLVYAVKIAVSNDGYIKLGMYGKVLL